MSKKRRSNFKSQTVNDAHRQKREASSYGYLNLPKGVKILNLKEKTRDILLDFIPYIVTDPNHPNRDMNENRAMVDDLWYKRPFKIHRDIGVDNEKFVCRTSVREKCPICKWVADQRRKGVDWDDIKDVAAKPRNLYAVIPIDSEDHDEVIHIWNMSHFLFQEELNEQLEEDPDNGKFPELEEGLTLKVKFRWSKYGKTLFPKTRDIEFEERKQQYTEDILDDVPNLDEMLNVLSYKDLEAKFLEMEDEEAGEDDAITDVEEQKDKPTQQRKTRVEKKEEPEKEEKDAKPHHTHRERTKKTDDDEKCPYEHTFGVDIAAHKDCDGCDLWDDCDEEYERREKQK